MDAPMRLQTLKVLTIGLLFSGCVKDVEVIERAPGMFQGNSSDCLAEYDRTAFYDGRILYVARGQKGLINGSVKTAVYYFGDAEFRNLVTQAPEDAGIVSFGVIDLTNDPATNYGRNYYQFTKANATDIRNEKQFGAQTVFAISGGESYGPCKTVVAVPEVILLDTAVSACNCNTPEVSSASLPYRIKWNRDAFNDKGVVVKITYDSWWDEMNGDTTLKNIPYRYNRIVVPDLGYYDLTASDLKTMPLGGTFEITISRGNEGVMATNGKTINVEVYTDCNRNYKLIP